MILPTFIFLFRTLPINTDPSLLLKWQNLILDFIWSGKRHRISKKNLFRDFRHGGLAVPNLFNYHLSPSEGYVYFSALSPHGYTYSKQIQHHTHWNPFFGGENITENSQNNEGDLLLLNAFALGRSQVKISLEIVKIFFLLLPNMVSSWLL